MGTAEERWPNGLPLTGAGALARGAASHLPLQPAASREGREPPGSRRFPLISVRSANASYTPAAAALLSTAATCTGKTGRQPIAQRHRKTGKNAREKGVLAPLRPSSENPRHFAERRGAVQQGTPLTAGILLSHIFLSRIRFNIKTDLLNLCRVYPYVGESERLGAISCMNSYIQPPRFHLT